MPRAVSVCAIAKGQSATVAILYQQPGEGPTEVNLYLVSGPGPPYPDAKYNISPRFADGPHIVHRSGQDIEIPAKIVSRPENDVDVWLHVHAPADTPEGDYEFSCNFIDIGSKPGGHRTETFRFIVRVQEARLP